MPTRRRPRLIRGDPARQAPRWLEISRSLGYASVRRLTMHHDDGGVLTPLPPPACPPGWRTGPPDFVGVGAQRCGTARWMRLLASHPEVVPPPRAKELHYFDRFYSGGFTAADASAYQVYFPRERGRKVGEWTPGYMSSPWIPPLLAEAAPEARIIVLLRDPIDRYLSGLQHATEAAKLHGAPISRLAPIEAFARGLYHAQITSLLSHFDRNQVLILQYERCTLAPREELRRTFAFLSLQNTDFMPDLSEHPKRQPSKPRLDARTNDAYVEAYSADVRSLARDFPEIDLSLWPNFAHLAE